MSSGMVSCPGLIRKACPWQEPVQLAQALARDHGDAGLIWLDGDGSALGRWLTLAVQPLEQHCCRGLSGRSRRPEPV
jgi:hypothetical protein